MVAKSANLPPHLAPRMRFTIASRSFSVLLAITGILLFSSKAVLVKLAYQYEVDSVSLLLLRMGFALPFYVAIAVFRRPQQKPAHSDMGWLVALGIVGYYLSSYFDFLGLQYIKAGLERLILFIYPTIILLLSWLIFGKRITRPQAIGVTVTYLGVLLIFAMEINISDTRAVLIGGGLVFLSAVTYASFLVGSGWLIPKFGATVFTSWSMIVSCCCVLVHYLLTQDVSHIFQLPTGVYGIALLMAVFATVIPSYLISYAIKGLGASNFSILASLGPVSTISLAALLLGEKLTWIQLAGAVVVMVGIWLAERGKK